MVKTRLVSLMDESKKYIYLQILWQWLALICQIFIVYSIATLIAKAKDGLLTSAHLQVFFIVALCGVVLRLLFDRLSVKASFKAGADVKRTLRDKIYQKLLRLGPSYREKVSTAQVVQMAVEGVEQLEIYFGRYLPQLFYSLLAPLTLFLFLSVFSLKAGLVLLFCVPLIPLSIVVIQKIAKRLLSKYWGVYTGLGDSFLENLQGLTTLKIYQADDEKAVLMDKEAQKFRNITMKVLTMQLNSTSVMDIMAYGGAAVGMVFAVMEYTSGNISLKGALFIILLAAEFFIPLRVLGSYFHIAMNGMAASDKIFNLLDLQEDEIKEELIDFNNYLIEFDQVCFSYNPEREILNDISLRIKEGDFVSLVGVSGCGKSTVAKILTGKNKNYQGSIKLGEKELSSLNEADIMNNLTLVTHNSYIFKGSVRDNLLMAKKNASDEELYRVLKEVNLLDFINEQDGLDTVILEKAGNISGGQAQRLALARALLHDSLVYIFDEATSNIDKESEEMIMKVVKKLAKKKTIILISHRLANVVDSDMIYMLEDGKIVQSGTHLDLLENNGTYSKLYNRQISLEAYGKEA